MSNLNVIAREQIKCFFVWCKSNPIVVIQVSYMQMKRWTNTNYAIIVSILKWYLQYKMEVFEYLNNLPASLTFEKIN